VLRADALIVGLVGGISEGADAFFRMLSGWFSDRIGKRKGLTVLGYGISAVAKPFLLLANSWGVVLGVRFGDRLGKGIRSSSRDALIADSVAGEVRGRAFGLHRAMDTTGAFLGIIIAALVVYFALGAGSIDLTKNVFQTLAWASVIPAAIAVILLQVFVREIRKPPAPASGGAVARFPLSEAKKVFNPRFNAFLVILAVFNLGSMPGNYFVILRAQNLGSPLFQVLLMLILFNLVYALAALPMGILSDRLGRRRVLALGWFVYALTYVGFALSGAAWHVWLAFACLGLYYAIAEGVARAFVADLAPPELRGTAYGIYYCVVGVCVLLSGFIGGFVWDRVGPAATFYLGAALALLAIVGMLTIVKAAKPAK